MPITSHRQRVEREPELQCARMKLERQNIEKPWGRTNLSPVFGTEFAKPIGEVWFGSDSSMPLLAKYLFTSERLSVQVHPNDAQARQRGLARGKTECWFVLDAEPAATIGLGLRRSLTPDQLRSAALDGSIVDAMQWRPVSAGDFFYVPSGTIHAIGGGISLLEFQQNSDATYRLYDYGRPRELHIEDAVAVATLGEYPSELAQRVDESENRILVDGPQFTFVHCHSDALQGRRRWVLPLDGTVHCRGEAARAGECLLVEPDERVEAESARLFIGAVC